MAEAKTRPAPIDLARHLAALPDPAQRRDCATLAALMQRVSGAPPVLWGSKIIGFGAYRYQYASGHGGDWPLTGFAPRGRELTVYVMDGFAQRAAQLAALGPHKTGKSCLYLKGLDGLDLRVLETMLAESVRAMRARHPAGEAIAPASPAQPAARKPPSKKTIAGKAASGKGRKGGKSAVSQSTTAPATKSANKAPTRKGSKKASGKTASSTGRTANSIARKTAPAAGRKSAAPKTGAGARRKPAARSTTARARKPAAKNTARPGR